ncbi:MAG: DUF1194 domain-containing protein [Leptolyngbyaceae cyanobacterium]
MGNRSWTRLGMAAVAISASAWTNAPALAATLVNTELVLSVDASSSVSSGEFALQQQGYVNAFRDAEVIDIIESLDDGIAVTLQYWSTNTAAALPWYHITDAASANTFADAVAATINPGGGVTNIAAAINSATNLLLTNDFEGARKVIDVSGDGTQNANVGGTAPCSATGYYINNVEAACTNLVQAARNNAAANEIIINGLPILTDVSTLDDYYQNYVITGEDAFIQPATTFGDFGEAVKLKIKREILPDPEPDPASVPEPSIVLGLLIAGGLGTTMGRRNPTQPKS